MNDSTIALDEEEMTAVQMALEKRPEMRGTDDIDHIFKWIIQIGSNLKIFQGVQDIIIRTICHEMTITPLPPKTVICEQGDFGDTFYIIISGSVSLHIRDAKQQATIEDAVNNARRNSITGRRNSLLPKTDQANYGKLIKHLHSGDSFGELAVIDPTAKRSCTVMTDGPASFICLKRSAYQRLVRGGHSNSTNNGVFEYLKSLYYFVNWPQSDLIRVNNKLRSITVSPNTYLARSGNECHCIYFIISGRVQESIPMECFYTHDGTIVKYIPKDTQGTNNLEKKERMMLRNNQRHRTFDLELTVLGSHDLCGENPIVFNKPVHHIDIQTMTEVNALVMERSDWEDLFCNNKQDIVLDTLKAFRDIATSREKWRQTRINLSLAHPGMVFTISTEKMMQLTSPICGYCGKNTHVTGDPFCLSLREDIKRKEEEKEKSNAMRTGQATNSIKLNEEKKDPNRKPSLSVALKERLRRASFKLKVIRITSQSTEINNLPTRSDSMIRSRTLMKMKRQIRSGKALSANLIMEENNNSIPMTLPEKNIEKKKSPSRSSSLSNSLYAKDIPQGIYRKTMMNELRKINSVDKYVDTKEKIMEYLEDRNTSSNIHNIKKPRVPRNKKKRLGKDARLLRGIDRSIRRMWPANPVVVEESLEIDTNSKKIGPNQADSNSLEGRKNDSY